MSRREQEEEEEELWEEAGLRRCGEAAERSRRRRLGLCRWDLKEEEGYTGMAHMVMREVEWHAWVWRVIMHTPGLCTAVCRPKVRHAHVLHWCLVGTIWGTYDGALHGCNRSGRRGACTCRCTHIPTRL